ncbi:MAG: sodium:proton antiporter, partial [Deltaproteobacteria bacterium]|nr:sodium:proton antiporter [Deltaproteobacteria bacterium]
MNTSKRLRSGIGITLLLAPLLLISSSAWAEGAAGSGFVPPVWTLIPFAGILLSIAVFPLFAHHFWEHHYPKVSLAWMVAAVVMMVLSVPEGVGFHDAFGAKFFSTYEEYVAFIILLGSLFIISGGIYISGDMVGTPLLNSLFMLVGALLASLIGTTGAAMLLIRPLLRANTQRRSQAHIVIFFIFLVCNIGGSLTPIGDPPLFLGFLQGIPFEWTLALTPHWVFTVLVVLGIFYAMDLWLYRKEGHAPPTQPFSIRLEGGINILLLLGVVVLVILSGLL